MCKRLERRQENMLLWQLPSVIWTLLSPYFDGQDLLRLASSGDLELSGYVKRRTREFKVLWDHPAFVPLSKILASSRAFNNLNVLSVSVDSLDKRIVSPIEWTFLPHTLSTIELLFRGSSAILRGEGELIPLLNNLEHLTIEDEGTPDLIQRPISLANLSRMKALNLLAKRRAWYVWDPIEIDVAEIKNLPPTLESFNCWFDLLSPETAKNAFELVFPCPLLQRLRYCISGPNISLPLHKLPSSITSLSIEGQFDESQIDWKTAFPNLNSLSLPSKACSWRFLDELPPSMTSIYAPITGGRYEELEEADARAIGHCQLEDFCFLMDVSVSCRLRNAKFLSCNMTERDQTFFWPPNLLVLSLNGLGEGEHATLTTFPDTLQSLDLDGITVKASYIDLLPTTLSSISGAFEDHRVYASLANRMTWISSIIDTSVTVMHDVLLPVGLSILMVCWSSSEVVTSWEALQTASSLTDLTIFSVPVSPSLIGGLGPKIKSLQLMLAQPLTNDDVLAWRFSPNDINFSNSHFFPFTQDCKLPTSVTCLQTPTYPSGIPPHYERQLPPYLSYLNTASDLAQAYEDLHVQVNEQ